MLIVQSNTKQGIEYKYTHVRHINWTKLAQVTQKVFIQKELLH
jgi:hypothetical protein